MAGCLLGVEDCGAVAEIESEGFLAQDRLTRSDRRQHHFGVGRVVRRHQDGIHRWRGDEFEGIFERLCTQFDTELLGTRSIDVSDRRDLAA